MATIKTIRSNTTWVSPQIKQGSTEADWIEYQPSVDATLGNVPIRSGTTSSQLVCLDKYISDGDKFVIRQNGTVYQGIANVTSSQYVESDVKRPPYLDGGISGYSSYYYGAPYSGIEVISGFSEQIIHISDDGLTMSSRNGNDIKTYSLSTPFDLTSRTLSSTNTLPVTGLTDIRLVNDGSTLFCYDYIDTGTSSDQCDLYTIDLTTPYDFSTMSFTAGNSHTVNFSNDVNYTWDAGVYITPDGGTVYVITPEAYFSNLGYYTNRVITIALSTPFDLTTASTTGSHIYPERSFDDSVHVFDVTEDGEYALIHVRGGNSGSTGFYKMTTPFQFNTIDPSSRISAPNAHYFKNDRAYGIHNNGEDLCVMYYNRERTLYEKENTIDISDFSLSASPQYVFTQLPEVSVCVTDNESCVSRDIDLPLIGTPAGKAQVLFGSDLSDYLKVGDTVIVDEGELQITGVVNTGNSYGSTSELTSNYIDSSNASSIRFNDTGTVLYVASLTGNVAQYTLPTAYDLSSIVDSAIDVDIDSLVAICIGNAGTKLYGIADNYGAIFEYDLSTAWDLTSNSFVKAESIVPQVGTHVPRDIQVSPDGTKMYVIAQWNPQNPRHEANQIHQYSLTTPFDIDTMVYEGAFNPEQQDHVRVRAIEFNGDGTEMFGATLEGGVVTYSLPTPYDVLTASYSHKKWLKNNTTHYGIAFNSSGTQLFTVNTAKSPNRIYGYDLPSAYNIIDSDIDNIWEIEVAWNQTPTFIKIKNKGQVVDYSTTPVSGDVVQASTSISTSGKLLHTFDSVSFEDQPKNVIQLAVTAGSETEITSLRANLWKAGTPSL